MQKKKLKSKIFITLFCLFPFVSLSQKFDVISFRVGRGGLVPHHKFMRYFIQKNVTEFNVVAAFSSSKNKQWQQYWNFPHIGVGFYYSTSVNQNIYGNPFASYLYSEFFIFQNDLLKFSSEIDIGAAYLTKKFDYQNNYLNLVIGSTLNIFASVNFKTSIKYRKSEFFFNVGLTHYSNGGTKEPNLGLNILAASVGYKYKNIKTFNPQYACKSVKNSNDIYFIGSMFYRSTVLSISNPAMPIYTITADYGFRNNGKWRYSAGFDYLYDGAAVYSFNYEMSDNQKILFFSSLGPHIAASALFGNVEFTFQQIFYIYQRYNFFQNCQRFGFRAFVWKKYIFNLTLTTHFSQALFIEAGLGYKFILKK